MRQRLIVGVLGVAVFACGRIGYDTPVADAGALSPDAAAAIDGGGDAGLDAGPDPDLVVHLALDGDPASPVDALGVLTNGRCEPGRCPTTAPGVFGAAWDFDGVDDYVRFDTSSVLDFGASDQPFSVSVWYRTRSRRAAQQVVFAQATSGGDIAFQLSFEDLFSGGTYDVVWKVCEVSCPSETFATLVDGVVADRWHLAVGVWDGTESVLYLDGTRRASAPTAGVKFDGAPFMVGADWESGGSIEDTFDGLLDDLRVYRRALTVDEQRALMVGASVGP